MFWVPAIMNVYWMKTLNQYFLYESINTRFIIQRMKDVKLNHIEIFFSKHFDTSYNSLFTPSNLDYTVWITANNFENMRGSYHQPVTLGN